MISKFHGPVKTEGAVAVGCSDLLAVNFMQLFLQSFPSSDVPWLLRLAHPPTRTECITKPPATHSRIGYSGKISIEMILQNVLQHTRRNRRPNIGVPPRAMLENQWPDALW